MQKNILKVYHALVAASMTSTVTSPVTTIQWLDNIAIQFNFTGTPTGTFFVQGSLDYDPNTNNPGTWNSITLNPVPVAAGSSGSILINMDELSFPYIRIQYVPSGGTGSLDYFISGKEI
jgi:hypothetical protein